MAYLHHSKTPAELARELDEQARDLCLRAPRAAGGAARALLDRCARGRAVPPRQRPGRAPVQTAHTPGVRARPC